MTWSNSSRRADLPGDWNTVRARILRRDPTCRLSYDCCTRTSTEVDHVGQRTDHRDEMLRGVCHACHQRRTQQQAIAVRNKRLMKRPTRRHPGAA